MRHVHQDMRHGQKGPSPVGQPVNPVGRPIRPQPPISPGSPRGPSPVGMPIRPQHIPTGKPIKFGPVPTGNPPPAMTHRGGIVGDPAGNNRRMAVGNPMHYDGDKGANEKRQRGGHGKTDTPGQIAKGPKASQIRYIGSMKFR